ncbi:MAG: hypothetical protein JSV86_16910 [Gemmatimonadota bacterium]|nr:MAG: hypothetical protein JSV86_16910 [Gemmatimonadota bacterium]
MNNGLISAAFEAGVAADEFLSFAATARRCRCCGSYRMDPVRVAKERGSIETRVSAYVCGECGRKERV